MIKSVYIVATPIGNMQDITLRAIETLKNVDCILAEDTRRTQKLLTHFGISNKLESFHKFNEYQKMQNFDKFFDKYQTIALVSDAGTPLISDPGHGLVEYLLDKQISVIPIPGVSALTTLLSVAGLPADKISFIGFLPHTTEAKKKLFEKMNSDEQTLVFFESPNRIRKTLELLSTLYPDTDITLGRELTKVHEEIIRAKCKDFTANLTLKGEFTVAIRIPKGNSILQEKNANASISREIADLLSNYLKIPKKSAYRLLLELKQQYTNSEE